MIQHTKGLLKAGKGIAVVADHPVQDVVDHPTLETLGSDAFEYYGGHLVAESVNVADARRIVACWNACNGIATEDIERAIKICPPTATGQIDNSPTIAEMLSAMTKQRDVLLEALYGVQGVMNNSEGVVGWHKNGDIASWDEVLPEVVAALELVEGEQS
ncbi:MAG: hypothetical protein ACRC8B_11365 [Aeromonas sobria]|uniref:hypothetical protein n=1 Tax=Aeromonas sobria TaxID=646 RepID=UPI003F3C988B